MRIGIDLGGTKIEVIALDDAGDILLRHRLPTPQGDYEKTLQCVVSLVGKAERELGARGSVGVGTPGSLSAHSGLLRNSNSVCLNGKPLLDDLQRMLGREVRLANDANCFALSEAVDGAGDDGQCVFGVIIGTGTGGGIVVNRHLLVGRNGIGGEWGHNPLPWPRPTELPGRACYCGQHGCIETWLSGPGFSAAHFLVHGQRLAAEEIAARARRGVAACGDSLDLYLDRLARCLAHVINILDPDVIVLGGGMSNMEEIYREVPGRWGRWVFSDSIETQLRRARHGDSSGVRGAAWLWDN